MRPVLASLALLLLAACNAEPGTSTDGASSTTAASSSTGEEPTGTTGAPTVLVSGDAFAFTLPGSPYGLIDGATIRVLEAPEFMAVTDAMGHFELAGLPAGATATFTLEHPNHPPARTKTFTLPDGGALEKVTFQIPDNALFAAMAAIVKIEIDPAACQMVSTVTRVGKSIYDAGAHGEADATVTITPALPDGHGPIYFGDDVIPDPALTLTTTDGGVLFVNVPPGTYTLEAHKDGVNFEPTTMQCEAGVLVNASPPFGLQALP